MAGAVDLEDLIDDMKAELSVPGTTTYANSTDAQWVSQLRIAFWEVVLDQIISGYTETDGIVTPVSGDTALARELQQVIIFYAGLKVVRNRLMDLKTSFRAKAGQAEYETQQSAQVLSALYKGLLQKRDDWVSYLGASGFTGVSYYIDTVSARDWNYAMGIGSVDGLY